MKPYPLVISLLALVACNTSEQEAMLLNQPAPVWPDCAGVTVPINLAPIRFALTEECNISKALAIFECAGKKCIVSANDGEFAISPDDWNSIKQPDADVSVRIQAKDSDDKWKEYAPFSISVSADSIDSHLFYRLIEPGYEVWANMGIYQRNLETYDEKAMLTNRQTNNGCMNCHSFNMRNPKDMLFHLRKELGGTYIQHNGKLEKLNTKTPETISALVYPYWHPSGRFVAFSTNDTQQASHSTDPNRIEVFDNCSDVVVYDVEKHEIISCPQLKSELAFETFPTFSPDGRTLYFCSADTVNVKKAYQNVHYSLCSISFDAETASFGTEVDTLYNARSLGGSISFPRVSPDGRWLLYTHHGYGNFSIWHKDADLWMTDLTANTMDNQPLVVVNSTDVESYHSWSSNSRWFVFASRRDDGLYTRPYLTHVDQNGACSKPVIIPQRDVNFYKRCMKSFNIPELATGPAAVTPTEIEQVARNSNGIDLSFRK